MKILFFNFFVASIILSQITCKSGKSKSSRKLIFEETKDINANRYLNHLTKILAEQDKGYKLSLDLLA